MKELHQNRTAPLSITRPPWWSSPRLSLSPHKRWWVTCHHIQPPVLSVVFSKHLNTYTFVLIFPLRVFKLFFNSWYKWGKMEIYGSQLKGTYRTLMQWSFPDDKVCDMPGGAGWPGISGDCGLHPVGTTRTPGSHHSRAGGGEDQFGETVCHQQSSGVERVEWGG